MKKIYKLLLCVCLGVCSLIPASSQDFNFEDILNKSKADGNYIFNGYFSPVLRAAGSGINQGWYNTAKPHKIAGLDITMSVAMVSIPGSDKNYTINNDDLDVIKLERDGNGNPVPFNGSGIVPTIFGSDTAPGYDFDDPTTPGDQTDVLESDDFDGPAGVGIADLPMKRFPFPVANIGIGLPKGTELKIRWTPDIDLGDGGKFKLFGIGVMHDIKQHIPGIKMLPFDLSGMIAFSKMDISANLNDAGTQTGDLSIKGTTVQAMISKKLSVITPYAAIGWGTSTATLKAKGHYDFDEDGVVDPGETDPFSSEGKTSGPRITTGLRLKLLIFTFHADYTVQKYSTFTAGFGLSVR